MGSAIGKRRISSSCSLAMGGVKGQGPLRSLGGLRGPFSHVREWPPLFAPLHSAGIYPASAALTATTVKSVHARSSFAFCSAMKASKSSSLTLSLFSV